MKLIIFCVWACGFSGMLGAISEYALIETSSPKTINIKDAITLAKQNNFELKKSANQGLEAKIRLRQNIGTLLPELSLRSSIQSAKNPLSAQTSAELKLPLIDIKDFVSISSAKDAMSASELRYNFDSDNLVFKIAKLYAEGLVLQSVRNVIKESVLQYEKQVKVFENKVRVGSMRRLDTLESLYELSRTRSDLLLKELEYKRKLGELGLELNLNELFLLENFVVDSPYLALDSQTLMAMALDTADIAALKKEIASYRTQTLASTFELLPKVFGTIENSSEIFFNGSNSKFSNNFMINLSWQIFNSSIFTGRQLNQVKQSNSEYSLAKILAERRLNMNAALETLQAYTSALSISEQTLFIAEENARSADRVFAQGELTGLDLMEAHVRLFKAKAKLEEDKLKITIAKLSLLFLIGKIGEQW